MPSGTGTGDEEESLSAYKARLHQQHSRPLIEQVSNQWKEKEGFSDQHQEKSLYLEDDTGELGFCDLEDEGSCPNVSRDIVSSRRFRRMFAIALLAALLLYYAWKHFVAPPLEEDWAYKEGFVAQENGTYGIAKGGSDIDPDLVRLRDLDKGLLPGGEADPEGKRRLVFVGDVHGCKKELVKLLEEVGFEEKSDHLVLVGDTISKGPDNVGVLDELMRLKATSVRGNHEDRILQVAKSAHNTLSSTSSKGRAKDVALLKQLKPHHIEYLRSMPLMLHIPTLPQASKPTHKKDSPISEHILVVHAGVVPGVPFFKQDPYYIMNMRSINRRTHVPSALRASSKNEKPWFDVWNWYNDRIFRKQSLKHFNTALQTSFQDDEDNDDNVWTSLWKNFWGERHARPKPQVVIYGHDSKEGLQIKRWSKGLDSACVSGGKLTALVLDAKGMWEVKSVGCKNYRG
ncbi:hypothetical protein M409DRAFT_17957 [Zasmidium cellare ATCC 36951]|uniref:Calcineurin-like phosphoesterase domain-containing protein n=1 Tax=Zasmidium cellare ATCC 36951 TaxID=1080233 RepID=A0A6A6CX69_ZASCE|nr:uncharacterized protein M409DRAFT_17957 [Zasmidium cellare ATCC 36951]KAF2171721.1 hypothetical protein M409DRAFT_17957 [Zasmidium cellare ATCC 36951]